jgi:hypothetical protein
MVGMGVTQSNFGTENLRSFIENIFSYLKMQISKYPKMNSIWPKTTKQNCHKDAKVIKISIGPKWWRV